MKTKHVRRAFKFRFYPTDAQAAELSRTFGCVRKVYNLALQARTEAWYQRQERGNYVQTSALLTEWKKSAECSYLSEVSSVPLQQALRQLQAAFVNFWEGRAKYPRFKAKKKSRASAEYTRSAFRWRDGRLTLAMMDQPLDIVWSRPLPDGAEPSTVTVSRDPAGRWFVSLLAEDPTVRPLIDAAHETVALSDAAWAELRRMLDYKCHWYGRKLVVVDQWYPSSKTCSACGHHLGKLPLNVREWTCPACGTHHDRDVNGAKNLLAVGQAVTACGAGVRPQRDASRTGLPAAKQEAKQATAGHSRPEK
ncbi:MULTISPECIES: RNA-guided endonuclease TnpB family protein [unclassified Streptomyces]|uniref:RNA-guided endonuclease InsQ/TnpB family protein n=1 Tax=unclassified Streptomyces TaxID=2593676 RepID=UPI002E8237B3|nr:RNA-guided endonuclease TnpB family protein [Streptomyces sp. NBC_00589]WTI40711.1 transposase [Streptomyces sp. NBC_00775]WUB25604.1 transposase [Streptomyces sp. NBC_00589]